MTGNLETIAQQIRGGELEAAGKALDDAEATEGDRTEALFLRGHWHERNYDPEAAEASYKEVLEQDPEHAGAAFRAALLYDQAGDETEAIKLYNQCVAKDRAHVNALVNLAILYEDRGWLTQAEACLKSVLAEHPNHTRARQFLKSVQSSYTMVYDETAEREGDQRDTTRDAPITDFELSVRSRNCLRQMNIRTIGDLLDTTEAELLSYKNFGETSLNEVKALLNQRGLKIGQSLKLVADTPHAPPTLQTTDDMAGNMQRPVLELELSVRSRKCLQRLGVASLGELAQHSELELMTNRNFGQTSLTEIKRQLALYGLSLRR